MRDWEQFADEHGYTHCTCSKCGQKWWTDSGDPCPNGCFQGEREKPRCGKCGDTDIEGFCEHCDTPFCSDHGSRGRDMPGGEGPRGPYGAYAVPSQCWMHGGYNADED